jgi:hypothetical protein
LVQMTEGCSRLKLKRSTCHQLSGFRPFKKGQKQSLATIPITVAKAIHERFSGCKVSRENVPI